jgi:isocitrate/isopropylmalate dehydrogenase
MGPKLIDAVRDCIGAGENTPDLGGTLTTMEFTEAVVRRVAG